MDDSIMDDYADGSDYGSVAKPKAKPVKKPAAPKAGSKKMAQPTLKTTKPKSTVPKKRAKVDSEDEASSNHATASDDEPTLSHTPPKAKKTKTALSVKSTHDKPLGERVNEAINLDGGTDVRQPKKGKRVSEQYQKLTQIEHILKRPDTYIGSIEKTESKMWVYNTERDSMEFREISYVPGLYKILDEILVNAADNKQNDKNMDEIRVTIDREKGEISVYNNGRGIPIEMHSKEQMYVPQMIFGNLLTSSNYDDDKAKVTGGRNGYGAKLTNIYSTHFTIETVDSRHRQKYKQTWTDNMSKMGKASITDCKGEDYTKVTFRPDFTLFKMSGMDDDFEALAKRRVYDLAGTCAGIKVSLNGSRVPVRSFKKYIELYTKGIKQERGEEAAHDTHEILVERPNDRWEIGFAVSDGSFQQVSFVNAVATTSGGTHVNYISDQICTKLAEVIKKKNKGGAALKIHQIKNHIFLFVNALIENPAFTSQTKEQLTTKASQFGSKCDVSDDFLKKIAKTDVVTNILAFAQQKADQILKKSDGSRRSRMSNPKLSDANKAGTKDGHLCTLILTEGDSAKGLAMAGRAVVGPDLFGVFPLRGKLLNVRDASVDQISKNAEIQNIKNFLGLQHKKVYTDTKSLRYGHLMIMTDQDHDGSHIKGLLINFLQVQYPSLLKLPEFLVEFITPIVKVWKGDIKNPSQVRTFYTMPQYEAFKAARRHEKGWDHKYYKGLGTSSTDDAQQYFNDIDKHHKEFEVMKDEEVDLIDLAFSKKKADERKEWLRNFRPGTFLDHSTAKISYTDFINKELILFSMADNIRSIPSVVDGLKPGQRKVLYTCFKRNQKKDIKVIELAGQVSGMTAYQHGETSLHQTIVGLAQTFVGSNNVNCLEPSGNFGSRLQGGSDAASPRYIYTRLSPFARKLFHPADEPLLTHHTDDDKPIEPEVYVPVVPLVLINGADGIGTGWSTAIPNYNPEDVVANLKRKMAGEPMVPMKPWFRGFQGDVVETGPDRFKFSGVIRQTGATEVEITELPIRLWTQDFKDRLEEIIKADKVPSFIKDYKDYNTHQKVHFIVQMDEKHLAAAVEEGLEERFKLTKTMATSNMVAFDRQGRIRKYASVEEIMDEFFEYRLAMYAKRKERMLADMHRELSKLTNQARFVQMIIDGQLVISKKKKAVLIAELQQLHFTPFAKVADAATAGETAPAMEDNDEDDTGDDTVVTANAYDYLLGMALWSLTQERVEKLRQQIGEREDEIDTLTKRSTTDLWTADLDDFIAEWRFQLADEKVRARNLIKNRRDSKKFALGQKAITKRKGLGDGDDSDFEMPKAKRAAPPVKPVKQTKIQKVVAAPKPNPLSASVFAHLQKPAVDGTDEDVVEEETALSEKPAKPTQPAKTAKPAKVKAKVRAKDEDEDEDEDEDDEEMPKKAARKPAKARPVTVKEDSDEEAVVRKPAARQRRVAAQKAATYVVPDDSDEDQSDDLLGDVGNMVKGLSTSGTSAVDNKSLFSVSLARPGTSHGYKAPTKSAAKSEVSMSDDETDYKMLAPAQSPRRSILITAKDSSQTEPDEPDDDDNDDVDNDDDDDEPVAKPAAKKMQSKAPPKKAPTKKAAATAPAPKKKPASPAAKAYAKRLAKKKVVDSDDDDMDLLADDILASADEDAGAAPAPGSRPARRAVATKKAPTYAVEDDDSDAKSDGFSAQESTATFSEDE